MSHLLAVKTHPQMTREEWVDCYRTARVLSRVMTPALEKMMDQAISDYLRYGEGKIQLPEGFL